MNPHSPFDEQPLTSAGDTRRRAILGDALRAADRRRRVRVARRSAAACLFAVVAGVVVLIARRGAIPESTTSLVQVAPTTSRVIRPAPIPRKAPTIEVQILRAEDIEPKWETINDDELLAELSDAGRPSGLIELNGKAMVVPIR